jgi:hypothetical protein
MRGRCSVAAAGRLALRRCSACGRPGIGWSCRRRNGGCHRLGAGPGRPRRGWSRRSGSRRRWPCCGRGGRRPPATTPGGSFGSHNQFDRYRVRLQARFGKGIVFRLGELNRHRLRLPARECEGDREILVRRHRQCAGGLATLAGGCLGLGACRHGFELDAHGRRLDFRPPIRSRSAGGAASKGQAGAQDDNHSAHVSTVHSEAGSHFPGFEMLQTKGGAGGRSSQLGRNPGHVIASVRPVKHS